MKTTTIDDVRSGDRFAFRHGVEIDLHAQRIEDLLQCAQRGVLVGVFEFGDLLLTHAGTVGELLLR